MSQQEKAAYYKALKDAGVQFDKHYRQYSTAELKTAHDKLVSQQVSAREAAKADHPSAGAPDFDKEAMAAAYAAMTGEPTEERYREEVPQDFPQVEAARLPVERDPNEMAGQRQNTQAPDEIIRVDEQGRKWIQEEVAKPAYPKPRGRRVLTYMDTGTIEQKVQVGDYVETFEVAGPMSQARTSEVKITLPSYQVGIYIDPRFPFKVHTYNGQEGFDLFDVQNYYGGSELVPQEIKRIYVSNVLCYDIRTTVRAIQTEYRQLQLAGRIQ